jgi:hypothetical protein
MGPGRRKNSRFCRLKPETGMSVPAGTSSQPLIGPRAQARIRSSRVFTRLAMVERARCRAIPSWTSS